jgi:hypothetical protein
MPILRVTVKAQHRVSGLTQDSRGEMLPLRTTAGRQDSTISRNDLERGQVIREPRISLEIRHCDPWHSA